MNCVDCGKPLGKHDDVITCCECGRAGHADCIGYLNELCDECFDKQEAQGHA